MKYLVLLAVVVLVVLYWRNKSRTDSTPPRAAAPAPAPALPEDMVRCRVCALHLPRAEATAAADGRLYCGQDHLLADARGDGR